MGFHSSGAHSSRQRTPSTKNVGSASIRRFCISPGTARPSTAGTLASTPSIIQLSGGTVSATSRTIRSGDALNRCVSQLVDGANFTGLAEDAAFTAAVTFAWNRVRACGSFVLSRACAVADRPGASNACGSNLSVVWEMTSSVRTGWLKRNAITIGLSYRWFLRYQSTASSLTVGVVNENRYGAASRRPLTATADVSTLTSYWVAFGSLRDGSGVKIRIVVPDQRNVP